MSGADDKLTDDRPGEPSAVIRERVESARALQRERSAIIKLTCSADVGPSELREFCQLHSAEKSPRAATTQWSMSARGFTVS